MNNAKNFAEMIFFSDRAELFKNKQLGKIFGNPGRKEAIEMYQRLHMWDEALSLAAAKAHPGLSQLKEAHMAWLMDSGHKRF